MLLGLCFHNLLDIDKINVQCKNGTVSSKNLGNTRALKAILTCVMVPLRVRGNYRVFAWTAMKWVCQGNRTAICLLINDVNICVIILYILSSLKGFVRIDWSYGALQCRSQQKWGSKVPRIIRNEVKWNVFKIRETFKDDKYGRKAGNTVSIQSLRKLTLCGFCAETELRKRRGIYWHRANVKWVRWWAQSLFRPSYWSVLYGVCRQEPMYMYTCRIKLTWMRYALRELFGDRRRITPPPNLTICVSCLVYLQRVS